MVRLSGKAEQIFLEIRQRIADGEFGRTGEAFIGVRELASRFSIRTSTAQAMFQALQDEGVLLLFGKKYYLSCGIVPSDSPLGKKRQERKIIALLCSYLESYYTPTFSDSVTEYLKKEGYSTIAYISNETSCRQDVRMLFEMGVQGIIVLTDLALIHKIFHFSNVPCISIGYDCSNIGADSILSGGTKQAKILADMMVSEGCTRFYFVTPNRKKVQENSSIYNAFVEQLHERKVDFDIDLIITEIEVKNNMNFLSRKLRVKNEKIGIVCTNEQITQWIMRWCDENNVSVPKEVMVAAFRTKSPMNQHRREIITVEENIVKEAEEAVSVLLKRIRGDKSSPKVIVVEPKVINRIEE